MAKLAVRLFMAAALGAGWVIGLGAFSTTCAKGEDRPKPLVWPSTPPKGCPFQASKTITGIAFTGKQRNYAPAVTADTWYFSWASDGRMYSPFADGLVNGANSICWSEPPATPGRVMVEGDDPLQLKISAAATFQVPVRPYGGRYPCGSLVYNGVWYYGTYSLMNENGSIKGDIDVPGFGRINWGVMGPFCGFAVCQSKNLKDHDFKEAWRGDAWTASPHGPDKPMFPEPAKQGGAVKIGSPHFVDFGRNMEHSPDGCAYLVAHGASEPDPLPRLANASWITGDQIYLLRVKPSPQTINDPAAYEFFAGQVDGRDQWTKDFKQMKPLIDWNNHCGCVTATYNAPLKKYLMCVTDGWPTTKTMDTYVLESDRITGPWRMVSYMAKFGEEAYFVNLPSKFISADGRTAWLCYSANFAGGKSNPPGSGYGLCLQQVKLLGGSGDTAGGRSN